LFAGDLYEYLIHPDLLVTLGSPRVGDGDYWKWYELNRLSKFDHYRLVDEKDVVPHVRPLNYIINYLASLSSLRIYACES